MSFDAERLYSLLPAVYRLRDEEMGGVLKVLLTVISEQAAVFEEDIAQLYDDHFIETCADWAVPYIGDLVGARGLDARITAKFSQRAQVANTLAYRRRKGTAAVLEQLAHDVTGCDSKVVEFFQLLATTQYLNHLRPQNLWSPDLRNREPLQNLNTPFESIAHTADVRSIAKLRGKFNIPNIGIFLWRLHSYSLTDSPAFQVDDRRYIFNPLGRDTVLYNLPKTEEAITHLAEKINVPMPLEKELLQGSLEAYYGRDLSFSIKVGGVPIWDTDIGVPIQDAICVGDLRDWTRISNDKTIIDPTLGRIYFDKKPEGLVQVTYHYAFSEDMGGGEYDRLASFDLELKPVNRVGCPLFPVPTENTAFNKIQDALNCLENNGSVEIADSGTYYESLSINALGGKKIEMRADDKCRPTIFLRTESEFGELRIQGDENSEVTLNGLTIADGPLRVSGSLSRLRLNHCTIVPGLNLPFDVTSQDTNRPGLIIDSEDTIVEIDRCITGSIETAPGAQVQISNSIVDAQSEHSMAFSGAYVFSWKKIPGKDEGRLVDFLTKKFGIDWVKKAKIGKIGMGTTVKVSGEKNSLSLKLNDKNTKVILEIDDLRRDEYIAKMEKDEINIYSGAYGSIAGGVLRVENCTIIGRVHSAQLNASNSLFLAEDEDGNESIFVENRQKGCVRFSYLPLKAKVGRRHRCLPEDKAIEPQFTSRSYGQPGYCQLTQSCASEIRQGADDGSEMGAFHNLFQAQRETNLRLRLNEYLRLGLEAGIFYVS
jgi:hypothetical protein